MYSFVTCTKQYILGIYYDTVWYNPKLPFLSIYMYIQSIGILRISGISKTGILFSHLHVDARIYYLFLKRTKILRILIDCIYMYIFKYGNLGRYHTIA
jgi:hypothetical protein